MSSKLVKALASTHEETRQEAVESLEKYISVNGFKLTLIQVEKLWKGLYYSMWLCDGPENQQDLSENLARIFNNSGVKTKDWVKYNEAFWVIIIKEWAGIDQWRMDKYYMLIRRILRYNFTYLNNNNWDKKLIDEFNSFMKRPLTLNKNMAIPYHLCDIYLDELEEFGDDIPEQIVQLFKELSKSAKLRTYRDKIKEDVLEDPRSKKWWFGEDEDDSEQDDDEEEWTGF
ncbi:nucleolar protein [Yamadazyma tenuis ATCC 10573]|uniref:Nucleolar protein n=1 Tax=Candida tenuis (strain ATCC 10573 / BCRC 21748 / CBS 615 / JCM 9827 / NBRC 10315 / NRRL Y-1498 / VKM Y-70) TaxID=590646 RepID=G3B4S2_CANTC|nr:nucleolar protein [Yamadazyma tenuis ATCC 10573]EGV63858.1 nucleolar protein [Yamadazyma tenuis ATCC 10573]